jgi:hypothetical protein
MPTLQKKNPQTQGVGEPSKRNIVIRTRENFRKLKAFHRSCSTLVEIPQLGESLNFNEDLRCRQDPKSQSPSRLESRLKSISNPGCNTYSLSSTQNSHPFIFDINIHLTKAGSGVPRKIMKRVLLDTGSDLNLISAAAHADLRTKIIPEKCCVHSVSGESQIVGSTRLRWNFISSDPHERSKPTGFSAVFHVLSKHETPSFDCILGHGWLKANRAVFWNLWSA